MKLGILFAGQGSQSVGMGKDLYDNCEEFRKAFDLLNEEQKKIAFEGPMEALSDTRNTQPIMVAFAAGVYGELKKAEIKPEMAAGLSLGEYSALHSSGVFSAAEAVKLVTIRANAMAEAAKGINCKMSAILNMDREILSKCCEEASSKGLVQIANYNCPGQIVIAGEAEAVDEAVRLAGENGARRCVPLPVSGPFHTKFMEPAGQILKKEFEHTKFGKMEYPVVFNAVGRVKHSDETVADMLIKQVSNSVFFEDSIKTMADAGIDTIIEVGPGKALSGFVRKTCKEIKTFNVEDTQSLKMVTDVLKGDR